MSDQTLFRFATMTEAQKDNAIRLVDCPSCGGSTFDDGGRPLVCHCGATIQEGATV
jgi:hypothetical protein